MPRTIATRLDPVIEGQLAQRKAERLARRRRDDADYLKALKLQFTKHTKNLKKAHALGFITDEQLLDNCDSGITIKIPREDLLKWRALGRLHVYYKSGDKRPCDEHPHGSIYVHLRVDGYDDSMTLYYTRELNGTEKCKYQPSTHTSYNLVCETGVE